MKGKEEGLRKEEERDKMNVEFKRVKKIRKRKRRGREGKRKRATRGNKRE